MYTLKMFKEKMIGRVFYCKETGVELVITEENCHRGAFLAVGKGAVDLGDGGYMRLVGNVSERDEQPAA